MPKLNIEEPKPRICLEEGTYEGTPFEVKPPFTTTVKNSDGKEVVKSKIIVTYKLTSGEVLPEYMVNVVTKGAGNYSNSSLYDWMTKMKYLDEFINSKDLQDDTKFVAWLNAKLTAEKPKVQVLVKNSNKDTKEAYSTVREILKRLK